MFAVQLDHAGDEQRGKTTEQGSHRGSDSSAVQSGARSRSRTDFVITTPAELASG